MAGLSAMERELIRAFAASELPVVTIDDLLALRPMRRSSANRILARLQRKGWLRRVKRGAYTLVPLSASGPEPVIEEPWPLAMRLFEPCFISGWTAAEHWDLTEQVFNSVALVTSRPQRAAEQEMAGVRFRVRTLSAKKLFGAVKVWVGSQRVEIASPHRLLIDILDDPSFGGGGRHTLDVVRNYWQSAHADPEAVLELAQRFGRGTVFKRLGFTAERFANPTDDWRRRCAAAMTAGVSKLDPAGPGRGKIVSRWRLRVNVPVSEA